MKDLQIPHVESALNSYANLNIGIVALDKNNMFGQEFIIMGETVIT